MIRNIMLINIFVGVGFLGCVKKAQISPVIEAPPVIRHEPIKKIETPKIIKKAVIEKAVLKQELKPIKKELIPIGEEIKPKVIKPKVETVNVEEKKHELKKESKEEKKKREMEYMIKNTPLILKNKSSERAYE